MRYLSAETSVGSGASYEYGCRPEMHWVCACYCCSYGCDSSKVNNPDVEMFSLYFVEKDVLKSIEKTL